MSEYNPAIHNPSSSMGAGTSAAEKGILLFNAIPHDAMKGSVFASFMGTVSITKSITGVNPEELMKAVAPATPGAGMKADVLNR